MSIQPLAPLVSAWRFAPLALVALAAPACGNLGCPDAFAEVDGVCIKLDDGGDDDDVERANPAELPSLERCDGLDNDLDNAVDESWPELGEPCGSSEGECESGVYVCTADGMSIECEGAVGPTVEVCDGLDNDCDGTVDNGSPEVCNGEDDDCNGLIDDGVLSIKQRTFPEHSTVAATDSSFAVARALPKEIRIETYDTNGESTRSFDDVQRFWSRVEFIESSASNGRLLVTYGESRYTILDARVDQDGVPVILGERVLGGDWNPGDGNVVYAAPWHARVSASPARFVGYDRNLVLSTSVLGPSVVDVLVDPTFQQSTPPLASFDAAGPYVAWEDGDSVRLGWFLDDGTSPQVVNLGSGTNPALSFYEGGMAVARLVEDRVRLSERGAFDLQCFEDGFCDASVGEGSIEATALTPLGIGYVEGSDIWIVGAGSLIFAVGRAGDEPVVQQSWDTSDEVDTPIRIDVETTENAAAVMQSSRVGDSVLTFMGCF